jgi:metal-dependent amidase/aminoacylase/carboxypeptidase family protein
MQMFEVLLPGKEAASGIAGASSDMGNVSYAVPTIHPTFAIPCPPGVGNHTPGFTAAAATPEAHSATMRASKALAFTALDLCLDPTLLAEAKAEFARFAAAQTES